MRLPLLFSLICAAGLAGASPPATPPVFSVHDSDRDGYLDQSEFDRLLADWKSKRPGRGLRACVLDFAAVDRNLDGRIGEEELLIALPRGPAWSADNPRGSGRGYQWRGGQ